MRSWKKVTQHIFMGLNMISSLLYNEAFTMSPDGNFFPTANLQSWKQVMRYVGEIINFNKERSRFDEFGQKVPKNLALRNTGWAVKMSPKDTIFFFRFLESGKKTSKGSQSHWNVHVSVHQFGMKLFTRLGHPLSISWYQMWHNWNRIWRTLLQSLKQMKSFCLRGPHFW